MRAGVKSLIRLGSWALAFGLAGCAHDPDVIVSGALDNMGRHTETVVYADPPPAAEGIWEAPIVHAAGYVADAGGPYLLDTGDRLRVFVYGQPNLSRAYTVDQEGKITVPLINDVRARGRTTREVEETIRRRLLHECDVHTLLRLPTGIFYAQGVKANVLFFDRKPGSDTPWTKELWIYDLRTNQHFTLKTNPLRRADLDDFVESYKPGQRGKREESERFHRFTYDELVARDKASLDIFWLRDESLEDTDNLPSPGVETLAGVSGAAGAVPLLCAKTRQPSSAVESASSSITPCTCFIS